MSALYVFVLWIGGSVVCLHVKEKREGKDASLARVYLSSEAAKNRRCIFRESRTNSMVAS